MARVSGHVTLVKRQRGSTWFAKWRGPDGHQVQQRLGPAWTERGRPPEGFLTKRMAQERLREILVAAQRGDLPGKRRSATTFADVAAEWMGFIEDDRKRRRSTVLGYRSALRSRLLPEFGHLRLDQITPEIVDAWRVRMVTEGSCRLGA